MKLPPASLRRVGWGSPETGSPRPPINPRESYRLTTPRENEPSGAWAGSLLRTAPPRSRHVQRPDRGHQRTPRAAGRLCARVPQPHQLHRPITTGNRRLQAMTTPSIAMSHQSRRAQARGRPTPGSLTTPARPRAAGRPASSPLADMTSSLPKIEISGHAGVLHPSGATPSTSQVVTGLDLRQDGSAPWGVPSADALGCRLIRSTGDSRSIPRAFAFVISSEKCVMTTQSGNATHGNDGVGPACAGPTDERVAP